MSAGTAQRITRAARNAELFRGVSADALDLILESGELAQLEPDAVLLDPAVPNDRLYCILSGEVCVRLASPTGEQLTTLSAGSCVGELSLIDRENPSAYVTAQGQLELLAFPHDALWEIINRSHAVARNLLQILSARLRFDTGYIDDGQALLQQYERNALTDPLTGLRNRHWLDDMLLRRLERARRNAEPLCLAMLDLDGFKQFNDSHGHVRGDRVLAQTAEHLSDLFRPGDLLARFGGDEFAVLLPGTSATDAVSVCQRVLADLAKRLAAEPPPVISATIGVTDFRSNDSPHSLIERADQALYRGKEAGGNTVARA